MCLDIIDLQSSEACEPNSIGLVSHISYARKKDITSGPAEISPITALEENGRIEGAFTMELAKVFKKIDTTVEVSDFQSTAKGRRGGNFDLMANLAVPFSTEQAIGLMNQLKYDDVVYIIHATSGRRFIMGWDKSGAVVATPNYNTQNTESSEDAGFTLELKATSPKVYFLKDDVVIPYT